METDYILTTRYRLFSFDNIGNLHYDLPNHCDITYHFNDNLLFLHSLSKEIMTFDQSLIIKEVDIVNLKICKNLEQIVQFKVYLFDKIYYFDSKLNKLHKPN